MIEIKGIPFEVEIERKRIKNLYLRVEGNKILASAPLRMPNYEIYNFINTKRNWIYKTYNYYEYKENVTHMYKGGDIFYVYNVPFKLVKSIGKKNIVIKENTIYLTYKNDSEDAIKYLYKHFDKLLLIKADEFLNKHLDFLSDYGYNQIPTIKCKIMSSKWGVCYTRKNMINISSYLIHYPFECLEYIIVHEMTHFIIPNHSKRFYEIVSNNMPEYKRASDKLKL